MDDKITNEVHNEQVNWSELPTHLIWMVKDRLDHVDNARVGLVCPNWNSASLDHRPPKTQDKCVEVPWLMYHHYSSNEFEFINISTMERLVLDLPEFGNSYDLTNIFLTSKQGWLLFRRIQINGMFLVLFNPRTNSSTILSEPRDISLSLYATFSLSDDKEGVPQPQRIVLLGRSTRHTLRLRICNVADVTWTTHLRVYEREVHPHGSLVIYEDKVYHLDRTGELLIFDINSHVWTTIIMGMHEGEPMDYIQYWMIESEGKIVKIGCWEYLNTFRFYKLNDNETDWEELNDDNDRSWFLHAKTQNNHFPAKEIGAKNKIYRIQQSPGMRSEDVIKVYNKSGSLIPSYRPHHGTMWVDLGMLDKPPSSCIKYTSI